MASQSYGALYQAAKRAAMTPSQRAAYLVEKRKRAERDRNDPAKQPKLREQAKASYQRAMADPVRKTYRRTADREKYWEEQPWAIARTARGRAKKLGVEHNLTREWVEKTWTGRCAITNIPFVLRSSSITAFSPSIDRKDNAKGYTQGNCRWVLFGVNAMKNVGTDADLKFIASAITLRSGNG